MNKTNYFIECLELMGYERSVHGWCNFRVDPSYIFQIHNIANFTIQELIKRDGVMERVAEWINTHSPNPTQLRRSYGMSGKYADYADETDDGVPSFTDSELIGWAIELGITPKELMGVEG